MRTFSNINDIVNANAITMVDGSKWVTWYLNNLKNGHSQNSLETIARLVTQ